jgi:valyl-tRNA synthetase
MQRLDLISASNRESFSLSTDIARLRKELEKSEALRQELESELVNVKSVLSKEKYLSNDKDRVIQENKKFFEGLFLYFLI